MENNSRDAARQPGQILISAITGTYVGFPGHLAQTRAVSLLNRQTAPTAKIASHAMTLTIQVQSTPPPSSGACTSWLSPYSGDHLAMSCIACGSRLIGMNSPPTNANSDMIRPSSCGTASAGTTNPMNSPNAA